MGHLHRVSRGKDETMRYILFDLDETLYPKETGLMDVIRERISRYIELRLGMAPSQIEGLRAEYYRRYGTTMRGLMINYHIDPEDYLAFVHDIPVGEYVAADPALVEMLAGIELEKDIFTNASLEYVHRILDCLGVKRYFQRIFDIRALDYISKPDLRAYIRVLKGLGATGDECLIVDNSIRNLEPAKELGMTTVLVGDDGEACVDFAIARVADLAEVLSKIKNVDAQLR